MPSPHFVGLQSYYCPDSPSSQKPTVWAGWREAGCLVGWLGGLLKGDEGKEGVFVMIRRKKKSMNPKCLLNRSKTGTPGSKWVTLMSPDAARNKCKPVINARRPPGLARYGWMWIFTGNFSPWISQKESRATMPPSQTLGSCVFHCKSAMKSSTLI